MEDKMGLQDSGESMDKARYWMLEAPALKAIAHMAIPMILGMVAISVYNFTDTLFVGMLGDTDALAALPLSLPVASLMLAVSMFFEVGAGTFISRSIGSSDQRASRAASSFALGASVAVGILIAALCVLLMEPLLSALGATGSMMQSAGDYLFIYCLGAPVIVLNMLGAQLARSIAKSKEASLGLAGSAILNIALDPVLIFGAGLGVGGAALATVISNAAGAVYFIFIIARSEVLSVDPRDAHLSFAQLAEIAKIGSSAMLLGLLMGVASLVFNNVAVMYGAAMIAAFGIAQVIVQLLELVTAGLYEGVVPLIGGAWGAGDRVRLRDVVTKTAVCLAVFCTVACTLSLIFTGTIVGMFSEDAEVRELGRAILAMQLLAVPFAAGSGLIIGVLQACSKGMSANILSLVKGLAFVPCVVLGNLFFGADGVIASLLAAEMLSFAAAGILAFASFRQKAAKAHGGGCLEAELSAAE